MKKLFTMFLIGAAFNSFAQLSQGSLSIGGQLGLSTSSSVDTYRSGSISQSYIGPSRTTFIILPQAQYFIIERLSIGLAMGVSSSSLLYTDSSRSNRGYTETSTEFIAKPFARYYYMFDSGNRVGVFGQFGIPLAFGSRVLDSRNGTSSVTYTSPYSRFGVEVSTGFIFFPSARIGIEASFGNILGFNLYTIESDLGTSKSTSSTLKVDIFNFNTMALNFGLMYYFGR